jgi:uncharacterized membrane protein (UPF0182 family)
VIRGKSTVALIVAVLAAVLLVGRGLSTVIVEQSWYAAMGASRLWREQLMATLALKLGAWVLGTAFAFANLWAVRLTIQSVAVPTRVADLELVEMLTARQLFRITFLASAAVGVVLTLPLDDWTLLTAVWRGEPFREYEGFFQRDLGFYVHWLPFEGALYTWALVSLVIVAAIVTVLYALTRSLRFEGRQLIARTHVRRHLTVLGSLVLILLSWSYRLDAYELLLWGSGFDGTFTAIDHRFTTRVDLALAVATFAAALIVLRTGWIGQVRAAFVTVSLVLVGALGVRQAGPGIAERAGWFALPEGRRSDYDATRAIFTRRAYAVDEIVSDERTDSAPAAPLADVARLTVWDAASVAAWRPAGTEDVTVVTRPVWQPGPGGPDAVIVTRSQSVAPVWDVRLLAGTHTDALGAPFIARHPALRGTALPEPLVAPDLTGYRLVDAVDAEPRLRTAASASTDSINTAAPFPVDGIPSVRLDGLGVRLAHAWATRDPALLSSMPSPNAAVVMHRDVRARLQRLLPTFVQGRTITPVLDAERLFWAVDVYAASGWYPLSIRLNAAGSAHSYFRLAGTALVDAQTGTVRIVRVDAPDALSRSWFRLLPGLVIGADALPPTLRALLPIPTDGSYATVRAFARVGSRTTGSAPRFVPDSLPGLEPFPVWQEPDGAISWSLPLIDGTDQLVGTFVARGGVDRRPRWRALDEPRPRWSALTSRLGTVFDSVTAVAGERDGPLSAGTLRTMIVAGRPWLARPAFSSEGGAPRLVALAIATDTAALAVRSPDRLPGASALGTATPRRPDTSDDVSNAPLDDRARTREARRLYEAAREAMQRGDWLRFGATMDSLGRSLGRVP